MGITLGRTKLEETMEFHDLQKTRVADLREMAKENFPDLKGIVGLKKEELLKI